MTNVRITRPAVDGWHPSALRFPGRTSQQQATEARRDLDRRLAAWRAEQGLTQTQLAKSICYSHSSVANAEIGRDTSVRRFWQDADRAVDARGAFLAAFDQMAALVRGLPHPAGAGAGRGSPAPRWPDRHPGHSSRDR
ncbi:helix-turn-helix domain-containing protein [Micromonospora cathayae]|uniref:Helix-turn-helix transcriptional regulator n=1 Tax=Micromonospora cathayae TaxID=3028804 RepID=A0ABY7ZWP3_9ACTN|nr:helix-turn-helix transcriptional regulator [Micromonospora sp. HUAS 3]WDZ87241.1 helix-turn-helix transcriptional regulator [Micromonospora sp. HUAS 3]